MTGGRVYSGAVDPVGLVQVAGICCSIGQPLLATAAVVQRGSAMDYVRLEKQIYKLSHTKRDNGSK